MSTLLWLTLHGCIKTGYTVLQIDICLCDIDSQVVLKAGNLFTSEAGGPYIAASQILPYKGLQHSYSTRHRIIQ